MKAESYTTNPQTGITQAKVRTSKRRLISPVSWLANWPYWLAFIFLIAVLGIVIYSIEHARWISSQPELLQIAVLAAGAALLGAIVRLPVIVVFFVGIFAGGAVVLWQIMSLFPLEIEVEGGNQVLAYVQTLWQTLSQSTSSASTLPFALFLAAFAWIFAYVSVWFAVRRQNPWIAIILGTIALLVNLSNLGEKHYGYFIVFLIAAGLFAGALHLARQYRRLSQHSNRYPGSLSFGFMLVVLCLSLLSVAGSWALPEVKTNIMQSISSFNFPWSGAFNNHPVNIFAAVPSKVTIITSDNKSRLTFGSPSQGRDVQFVITSDKPLSYLRIQRYSVYDSSGWTRGQTSSTALNRGLMADNVNGLKSLSEVTIRIESKLKTDMVFVAGELKSSDIPLWLHSAAEESTDLLSATSFYMLNQDSEYRIRAAMSTAMAGELAEAGEEYPQSITSTYLQLPEDLPRRITTASRRAVADASTQYDKVMALVHYLSQFAYNREGAVPPYGTDAVDYFLTTAKSGNCTNFASALVVMLRTLDIPARISAGYLLRDSGKAGVYEIRAEDYHARAEVYFPGYGWTEFEATPASGILVSTAGAEGGLTDPQDTPESENTPDSSTIQAENSTASADKQKKDTTKSAPVSFEDYVDPMYVPTTSPTLADNLKRVVAVGVPLLLVVAFAYRLTRRFMKADSPQKVYRRLRFMGSLAGFRSNSHLTPLEYGAMLAAAFPVQAVDISNLTWEYVRSCYQQSGGANQSITEHLSQSWRIVVRGLIKHLLMHGWRDVSKAYRSR